MVVEGQEAAPGGMDAPPELHADQTDYIDYVWSSQRLIVVDEEVLDRPPWGMVVVEDSRGKRSRHPPRDVKLAESAAQRREKRLAE